MKFPYPLSRGVLVRRYKRFLADVELPGGELLAVAAEYCGDFIGGKNGGRAGYLDKFDGEFV